MEERGGDNRAFATSARVSCELVPNRGLYHCSRTIEVNGGMTGRGALSIEDSTAVESVQYRSLLCLEHMNVFKTACILRCEIKLS